MRHLIDKWVAAAKLNRAKNKAIEVLEDKNSQPFESEAAPLTGTIENLEMGEVTGSLSLIAAEIDRATKSANAVVGRAKDLSATIGMVPVPKTSYK